MEKTKLSQDELESKVRTFEAWSQNLEKTLLEKDQLEAKVLRLNSNILVNENKYSFL